ncbi:MAG: transglycosylase SLT domain-containing protein [Sterolibacterium sp.]|nr:transglycosylase SLT domain-containing protein [Sterolibacterium sp.]
MTFPPIKRLTPRSLFRCLVFCLLSGALCAQAETPLPNAQPASNKAPITTARRLPVQPLAPELQLDNELELSAPATPSFLTPAPPHSLNLPLQQPAVQPATNLRAINNPPLEMHNALPHLETIDLTAHQADLWQRVRNGFSMADLDSPLVAERQAWYLNRPEMLKELLRRSRPYLYFIVGELEKRGMPTELALLPMVESAYNPMAYSSARAAGLWQFIPSTGKNYSLRQDWWHDQRRDIIASTGAALDYLQNIYEMHGDWHLALASYNWGEFAVARAISRNLAQGLPADYASLRMPDETRYYVPKLQALKNIIADPTLFGMTIEPIPNQPYFDTVDKPASMDISLAAKLAEMPLSEFIALNPAYNRPVMPENTDTPIVLPTEKVATFLLNLERHEASEKPLSNWTTHVLKKGESLDRIAARFHISTARLRQINGIGGRTRVHPGTRLLVPGAGAQLTQEVLNDFKAPAEPTRAARGKSTATGKAKAKARSKQARTRQPKANKSAKSGNKSVSKARSKKSPKRAASKTRKKR